MSDIQKLKQFVKTLPGENGWWHQGNEVTFRNHAVRMFNKGLCYSDIIEILEDLYDAVSDEYGG